MVIDLEWEMVFEWVEELCIDDLVLEEEWLGFEVWRLVMMGGGDGGRMFVMLGLGVLELEDEFGVDIE